MIERLTLIEVEVPFLRPLTTAHGTHDTRRSILIGAHAEGHIGWGEAPAFPSGRYGTADEAWAALSRGRPESVPIAAAGFGAAVADLEARLGGIPLHQHLGGTNREVIARPALGIHPDPGDLVKSVETLVADGYQAIKLKIRPGADIDQTTALRSRFPGLDISVDANATYRDPTDPVFDTLAGLGIGLIEQPFPAGDLRSSAILAEASDMLVCLDESIDSVESARRAVDAGAADVISIKVLRHGLPTLRAVLEVAAEAGTAVKVGGTFDTSIGRRYVLACATLPGVERAEVAPPTTYLGTDTATYPTVAKGSVRPTSGPGIDCDPDADLSGVEVRRDEVTAIQ